MRPGLLTPERVTGRGEARRRASWSFTPLTLWLLVLGAALVIPVWVDRRALAVLAAWNVAVLTAWAVDVRRLPAADSLVAARSWRGPLVLAADTFVDLDITSDGSLDVAAWATDCASPVLARELRESQVVVPARGTGRIGYRVCPRARGDVEMGDVTLRYRSRIGLAERWATVPLAQVVRIYPDAREGRRQTLALIRAKQVAVEKRRAVRHGLGRDFESLREFQDGDELRDVCWSATARRGKLVTRTYRPERNQSVWLVVDAGRLMRARDGDRSRLDHAVNAAFALAQVASAAGDRVGLLAYGRAAQQRLLPGRGAHHLRAMLEALALVRSETSEADHARAASAVMTLQKRRSLVVWMTEIAETAGLPEVVEGAARIAKRHVVLFALLRHVEVAGVATRVPETTSDLFRVFAAQEIVERRALLLAELRRRGAQAVDVPAAELATSVVARYLEIKERNLV